MTSFDYMSKNTVKTFDLTPNDGRKSFYGKAKVTVFRSGAAVLRSYNTDVAAIDESGRFLRLWGGYSSTTMRHVNAFLSAFGIDGGGKKWWDATPTDNRNFLSFALN